MRWLGGERAALSVALVLASLLGLACGGSGGPPRKTCFPVKGQLFVKSQPAAGAVVVFHPAAGEDLKEWPTGYPTGEVQSDGNFALQTYEPGDGAPAGDYTVVVTWPQPPPAGDEEATTVDRLQGRYADPRSSQLKAKVEAGPTELPPFRIN
jgi:hypothetical protein